MSGRVLHVIPSISPVQGGPSSAIRMIEKALDDSEWQSETATTNDDGPGRKLIRSLGSRLDEEGATRWYFEKNTEFYKVASTFIPWIRLHVAEYDVVHVHALFSFMSVVAALAARRARVPYIVRPLGVLNQYGLSRRRPFLKRLSLRSVEGPILRHAAAVHFTAEAECQEASALGLAMRPVIIPLGYDLKIKASRNIKSHGSPATDQMPKLLFLSRLDPIKNVEALVDAVGLLRSKGKSLYVNVAGDGPSDYVCQLQSRAASLGLGDRIRWLGHVSGEAKARLLETSDIFVLPSYSENFGISLLEAMEASLPCVVGRGVALSSMLQHAGAGVAVDTSAEAIAAGIQHYLGSETERHRAGIAARELAEREFSMDAMSKRLITLYDSVRDPVGFSQRGSD